MASSIFAISAMIWTSSETLLSSSTTRKWRTAWRRAAENFGEKLRRALVVAAPNDGVVELCAPCCPSGSIRVGRAAWKPMPIGPCLGARLGDRSRRTGREIASAASASPARHRASGIRTASHARTAR